MDETFAYKPKNLLETNHDGFQYITVVHVRNGLFDVKHIPVNSGNNVR